VRRRNFPSRAGNLLKQVTTRVGELVNKGVLRRTADRKAVSLPKGSPGKKPTPPPAPAPAAQTPSPKAPKAPSTPPAEAGRGQSSLRLVLTRILQKSSKPLGGGELARRARAAGYQSQSKDFTNVVWVTLGKMDDVEHLPGKGYRLKKRPG